MEDALPSDTEKANIRKLRDKFKEEFSKRKSDGRDFPCLFGDLALTRVLRGNDDNLDNAMDWFRTFLCAMEKHNVDDLVVDMTKKLDESGSQYAHVNMLPHHEEIQKYFPVVVTAPQLTLKGDVIQYIAAKDFDKVGLYEEVEWEHWVKFQRSLMILRCLEADRLSHTQKRMVKCVTLIDLLGCELQSLFYRPFERDHSEDVGDFNKSVSAEVIGECHLVNPSWGLGSLAKLLTKFAPPKFQQKCQFHLGDSLKDKPFVQLMGGQAQLEELYATRLDAVNRRQESVPTIGDFRDNLATDEEQKLIDRLRCEFKSEFEQREAEGRAWPFLFGDIALTRILRGNCGSFKAAKKWFSRFLEKMNEHGVDNMIPDVIETFNENGSKFTKLSQLPGFDAIKPYFRATPCAVRSTPSGDPISYIPLVDLDRQGILDNVNWEQWVKFMRCMVLIRAMHVDHQTRLQGRLVRLVNLWDLNGFTLTSLKMPAFNQRHQNDVSKFMQSITIEVLGPQYVLNAPWILYKTINLFFNFLPVEFTNKFTVFNTDGLGETNFVEVVGGKTQLQQLLATRVGLCIGNADENSGDADIGRGVTFEKVQDVQAGQRITWTFEVVGGWDRMFGVSDVEFSVRFVSVPDTAEGVAAAASADDDSEKVVRPLMVAAGDGEVNGSYLATSDGFVMLQWSNEHSTYRRKSIKYNFEISRDEPCKIESSDDLEVSTDEPSSISPSIESSNVANSAESLTDEDPRKQS